MLCAVGGHEVGPHVVVGTPNIDVVYKGVGDLSGRDETQCTMLMAVEDLGEAFVATCTAIVEPTCEAVVRHDIGEVFIGQAFDITNAVAWLAPKFLGAVVAVLDEEGAFVDGFVHHVTCRVPFGEVRHGLWNVATACRSEIV